MWPRTSMGFNPWNARVLNGVLFCTKTSPIKGMWMGLHIQPNICMFYKNWWRWRFLQFLDGMLIAWSFPSPHLWKVYRAGFFRWFIDDIEIYTCHDHTSLRHPQILPWLLFDFRYVCCKFVAKHSTTSPPLRPLQEDLQAAKVKRAMQDGTWGWPWGPWTSTKKSPWPFGWPWHWLSWFFRLTKDRCWGWD